MINLILASQSPRRRELLERAGIPFQTVPSLFDEKSADPALPPSELVLSLSFGKASEVRRTAGEESIVLGADTVVSVDGVILGKPEDEADAFRMLSMLRNRTHDVYTGVALLPPKSSGETNAVRFAERTEVTMRDFTDEEAWAYIKTGEPMGKAGAYAIQGLGTLFITGINGDYNNVVGLPLTKVYVELKKIRAALS